ncbi:MAG: DUF615 domain-containing protein [Desulfobulbaceae bacterium]|nr:DUF615 domain-containing protein [Desulfobulbaceae bacterium]HIJ79860.1 DUF615 domain-containing protein [Deltaproteobacteria bacterium]
MATKKSRTNKSEAEEPYISRSEKKRLAKKIEELAKELIDLPISSIKKLPCDDLLRNEIIDTKSLKAGALKRQIKFIAKELRQGSPEELLVFLEEKKGSQLKKDGEFHELERIREDIITEALGANEDAEEQGEPLDEQWQSSTIDSASAKFPSLDVIAVKISALRYVKTRKPAHRREIFRQLKSAMDRLQLNQQSAPDENQNKE